MKVLAALLCVCASRLYAQSNLGELRLTVIDPAGIGVKTAVRLSSEGSDYHAVLDTSSHGTLDAQRLPYGVYRIEIRQPNFAVASQTVSIHSPLPPTDEGESAGPRREPEQSAQCY